MLRIGQSYAGAAWRPAGDGRARIRRIDVAGVPGEGGISAAFALNIQSCAGGWCGRDGRVHDGFRQPRGAVENGDAAPDYRQGLMSRVAADIYGGAFAIRPS